MNLSTSHLAHKKHELETKNNFYERAGNMYKIAFAVLIATLMATTASKSNAQGLPVAATIQFGNTGVGSGFPPTSGHDRSGNAADKLIPGAVNIATGGTVTFMIVGSNRHQVAVYPPGTLPIDVNTGNVVAIGGCGGPNYIDDGVGAPLGQPPCGGGLNVAMQAFNQPGRYLVICRFRPHFNNGMWGWVNVQ